MSLIYFPLTIFNILTKHDESFARILLKMVRNYTFVGEQFYSWQLWYLLSSVLGITVLYFLYKNNKVVGNIDLLKYAVLSFSLAYVINQYYYYRVFQITIMNGRIFTGISYIMLGMLVSRNKKIFTNKKALVIPFIMMTLSVLLKISYSTTNIPVFISVSWITGLLINGFNNNSFFFTNLCRELSSLIYYCHMYFLFAWMYILPIKTKGLYCFTFVLLTSIVFSISYFALKNKYSNALRLK